MCRLVALVLLLVLTSACSNKINKVDMPKTIRNASVAGQFYPLDKEELNNMFDDLFKFADKKAVDFEAKAFIAPHAGYVYSGEVSAKIYKHLEGREIDTVYILGNSHTQRFAGIAIDTNDVWKTPLGEVLVNKLVSEAMVKNSKLFNFSKEAHESDHVIEVQVPFLQKVLGKDFKIVPMLFGNTKIDNQAVAMTIKKYLSENDIFIISSDLSHYPSYEKAKELDNKTLEFILSGDFDNLNAHIDKNEGSLGVDTLCCGIDGVKSLMYMLNDKNWSSNLIAYMNSGDTAIGDKERVVGYGGILFGEKNDNSKKLLNSFQKEKLLDIAREATREYVINKKIKDFEVEDKRLWEKEGTFVTLHSKGALRGCIGLIESQGEPLWKAVRDMAISAATEDPRFLPVEELELDALEYEVSVLSVPKKIDDWTRIELGKHGVIIKNGFRSGVFLPQVADETGWSRDKFLEELCENKAGMDKECYKDKDTEIHIFTAQVFIEE